MSDDETHDETRATIWMSGRLSERVDDAVDWKNSSRSEWVRRAVQDRLLIEDELEREGLTLPTDDREREAMIREILFDGLDDYTDE